MAFIALGLVAYLDVDYKNHERAVKKNKTDIFIR